MGVIYCFVFVCVGSAARCGES